MVKSEALRSGTGWPLLSVATTSTTTRRVLVRKTSSECKACDWSVADGCVALCGQSADGISGRTARQKDKRPTSFTTFLLNLRHNHLCAGGAHFIVCAVQHAHAEGIRSRFQLQFAVAGQEMLLLYLFKFCFRQIRITVPPDITGLLLS